MMGVNEKQTGLWVEPVNLARRVPEDHILRKLNQTLDLSFMRREVAPFYGKKGNVSVDPVIIMKMMLLLFLDNVKSERELMRIIPLRIDYIWYLGYGLEDEIPNHSVLSKARMRWGIEVFEKLFKQTITQCLMAGLIGGSKLHVDNSADPVYLSTAVKGTLGGDTAEVIGKLFIPKTPEAFTYDKDGNLLSDGRWTYQWDGENRLIGMETQAGAAAAGVPKQRLTFAYDQQFRRISKRVEDWKGSRYQERFTILFLYDGWNLTAEVLAVGPKIRSYVWGSDLSGGMAAGGVGGLLFVGQYPEDKIYSVGYDGNGNVTGLFSMGFWGENAASYEYGIFGELLGCSGLMSAVNPIGFSAKYVDSETGLVYYGHRYLSAFTGSWLSRDPIGEDGGVNLYGFINNDPVGRVDILGLSAAEPKEGDSCCCRPCEFKIIIQSWKAPPDYIKARFSIRILPEEKGGGDCYIIRKSWWTCTQGLMDAGMENRSEDNLFKYGEIEGTEVDRKFSGLSNMNVQYSAIVKYLSCDPSTNKLVSKTKQKDATFARSTNPGVFTYYGAGN